MGVINRRSGLASGSSKVWQSMVASSWKGVQVIRNYGSDIEALPTTDASKVHSQIAGFADRWHTALTLAQQQAWDEYAASLGSAINREKSDNISYAKQIVPRHSKLLSGINAYIRSNITAYLAGIPTPLDIAPLGAARPAAASNVALNYTAPNAVVSWADPIVSGTPTAAFVRVWAKPFYKGGHRQLVLSLTLPSPMTANIIQIQTGHSWDSPTVALSTIKGPVILRVQMDTIVQRSAGEGVVTGPGSNVAQAIVTN